LTHFILVVVFLLQWSLLVWICWQVFTIPFFKQWFCFCTAEDLWWGLIYLTYVTQESLWEHLESLFFKPQKVWVGGFVRLAVPPSQWWWWGCVYCHLVREMGWQDVYWSFHNNDNLLHLLPKWRRGFRALWEASSLSPGVWVLPPFVDRWALPMPKKQNKLGSWALWHFGLDNTLKAKQGILEISAPYFRVCPCTHWERFLFFKILGCLILGFIWGFWCVYLTRNHNLRYKC
jgi:hypothetical protein